MTSYYPNALFSEEAVPKKSDRSVDDIKKMNISTAIRIVGHMKPSIDRDQLDAWIFDTHYRKIQLTGSLTNRIRPFNTKTCYREFIRRCFNGKDINMSKSSRTILPQQTTTFIKELHEIQPALTGIFIDYLIRRLISEQLCIKFEDTRASRFLKLPHKCNNDSVQYDTYTIKSLIKICKDKCWAGYSSLNKKELVEFIESKLPPPDICRQTIYAGDRNCLLPTCQHLSYQKMCNTSDYKTDEIILEIFIVSLTHSEWFGNSPKQDTFDRIYELLQQNGRVRDEFVYPLNTFCTELIRNKMVVKLNPTLGNKFLPLGGTIQADADLIIDDTLIDIKCTIGNNEIYEILQMLGYTALARTHEISISSVKILNLLLGIETTYNVDEYRPENWHSLLHLFIGLREEDICMKCENVNC